MHAVVEPRFIRIALIVNHLHDELRHQKPIFDTVSILILSYVL